MSILENPIPNEVLDNATSPLTDDRAAYKDSTYEIVSKVAYLIGVPKRIFDNEHEAPKVEVYNRLDSDKTARIIRHLCIVRTAIERNFKRINERMRFQYETILSMPEYVPQESINQLSLDGVNFIKNTSKKLCQHVVEINRLICDSINNCKKLFPLWINWDYIKALFVMPDGLKEDGTREAADIYYSHLLFYPYQMYINWQPEEVGNILYNDKKFVTLLYSWNNDYFTEYSKVSDAGSYIKGSMDLNRKTAGILIALFTGVRIGELCGLQMRDISLTDKTISINKTVQRIYDKKKGESYLHIGPPKTKTSARTIPVPSLLMNIIKKFYTENPNHYFLTGKTKPTEPRTYRQFFTRFLKRNGLEKVKFHEIRHTFAVRAIEIPEFDIKSLSEILGHKNVSFTLNVYGSANLQQKVKCMNLLNDLL